MIHAQATKVSQVLPPAAAVNNASASPNSVDCAGWDYCEFHVSLGATDIALTALKLQEADDNSTFSDVVGTRFGTDTDMSGNASTLPTATSDDSMYIISVDSRKRKRYLKPVITVGNGTTGAFLAVEAVLSRGAIGPHQASDRGAAEVLRV